MLNAWEEYRERRGGTAATEGRRECVAVAAALRSKIELVPKSGRCNCGGPATPDGQSQAADDTKRAAQPERIQREFCRNA